MAGSGTDRELVCGCLDDREPGIWVSKSKLKMRRRASLTFLLLPLCPFCGSHVLASFGKICSRHNGTFWCG